MSYEVIIVKSAVKELKKLPKTEIVRVVEKIEKLGENPYPNGSIKLKATTENLYRIRQGNYRVIYLVEDEIKIVEVRRVAHRKDVYQ